MTSNLDKFHRVEGAAKAAIRSVRAKIKMQGDQLTTLPMLIVIDMLREALLDQTQKLECD